MSTLLSGLMIGESPRWHAGRLWFSHWGTHEVVAVDADGRTEIMAEVPATIAFSIDWLPDGRLLIVSGPDAKLLRQEPDGSLVTHADLSGLAAGWNEIVVDGRGNAYVNGSDFDFMGGGEFVPGIIALVGPDGSVRKVADDIHFGNGMVVTPDNATLIVAESFAARLTAFDIAPDGALSNRRCWAPLEHGPDGLCLDTEGAVWAASGHRCVRVREGGEVLDTIELERFCFAAMLGGADGRTLFTLSADWRGVDDMFGGDRTGQILTAPAPAAGAGWPAGAAGVPY